MHGELDALKTIWQAAWPGALAYWSRFVQLSEPSWCFTHDDERRESLAGSFAMIRLVDHVVVISLRQVHKHGLHNFATEILAHEIGHHVYCPADLTDNARLLARIRAGLPTKEQHGPVVSNLYTDLLINHRLQRAGLNIAGVYQKLSVKNAGRLWTLYMRIYEVLWNLPRGTLAAGKVDARINADASLGARLIRSYSAEWLDGAGRFACLCLPYLLEDEQLASAGPMRAWLDTQDAGAGGLPDGLAEIDESEIEGAIHPADDPELSGVAKDERSGETGDARERIGGQKTLKKYRQPFEYADVLQATGAKAPREELIARYYRERAMPWLVRFPQRETPAAIDPYPEGLDPWDVGEAIEDVDWLATVMTSPQIIPGVTTRQRLIGTSPGTTPERTPIDLYLGVDCSGSMGNPADHLSYPVLAGAIIALSALRAGSRVKVVLSGEPGRTIGTDGFVRDEMLVLKTLTDYLGTGTTFGIHRLAETFNHYPQSARPVHILIVTDNDIFSMLDQCKSEKDGWTIARDSLAAARGGGTYVLQLPEYLLNHAGARQAIHPQCERMKSDGWDVANIDSMEELLQFARRFSEQSYGQADLLRLEAK